MAFNALRLGDVAKAANSGANLMLSGWWGWWAGLHCCRRISAKPNRGNPFSQPGRKYPAQQHLPASFHAEVVSVAFRKSGMLAADGRCKTLDAAADGYVRAEAAGALFVEMLPDSQVQQAGSQVTAIVSGSAVGQDGRSSGLTAPNGPAQQEVMRAALVTAGLSAGQVGAVQLHGTGTSLGDPIEVGALAAVMVAAPRKQPLALMAGKSLIGHSEPAAGVMGLAHAQLSVALSASLPILHLHAGKLLLSCCWQQTSHAKPLCTLRLLRFSVRR